jgi:hypothetical protein
MEERGEILAHGNCVSSSSLRVPLYKGKGQPYPSTKANRVVAKGRRLAAKGAGPALGRPKTLT